jgi:branched-chain amino acid transport system substrate-binding protein
MIFKAIQSQGKADTEAIRGGLLNMGSYQGISGAIEYKQTGDPVRSAVILKIKGGKTILHKQVNP